MASAGEVLIFLYFAQFDSLANHDGDQNDREDRPDDTKDPDVDRVVTDSK